MVSSSVMPSSLKRAMASRDRFLPQQPAERLRARLAAVLVRPDAHRAIFLQQPAGLAVAVVADFRVPHVRSDDAAQQTALLVAVE